MVRFARAVCLSVAIAWTLSCGGGGGSTPTTPSNPTPPPAAPSVTSLTVTAPASSATVGQSAQFTATAVMSNGTTQTVTSQASWQSSNAGVATVSASGMVAAVASGQADIRGTYQSVSGSVQISVTSPAPSSFSLCGTIRGASNAPLSGAEAEIRTGADAGKKTSTDNSGNYCLSAVRSGTFSVRASKADYNVADQNVTVSGNTTLNFTLTPTSNPTPNPTPPPNPNPNPTPPPDPTPVNMICNAAAYPSSASCGTPSAVCNDNTLSCSQNRQGTCSTHNGVKCWLCPGGLCNGGQQISQPYYSSVPLPWDKR